MQYVLFHGINTYLDLISTCPANFTVKEYVCAIVQLISYDNHTFIWNKMSDEVKSRLGIIPENDFL